MDVQGNRQMQPTQKRHGIRWQLEPEVIARIEAHEQLRHASLCITCSWECPLEQLARHRRRSRGFDRDSRNLTGRSRTSQPGAASIDGVSVTT